MVAIMDLTSLCILIYRRPQQGLIRAPTPAKLQQTEEGDNDFWDKQGPQGLAKQLQSTEDALPGGHSLQSPAVKGYGAPNADHFAESSKSISLSNQDHLQTVFCESCRQCKQ